MENTGKKVDFSLLSKQLEAFAGGEKHYLPLLSNASALIWDSVSDINWAGFYLMQNGSLLLGPFQGKVACIRIPVGRGVCGTAVSQNKSQLVKNVHEFPGHIACDSASNSEVVVPLHKPDGSVFGVLDIDSPLVGRFSEDDLKGFEKLAAVLESNIDIDSVNRL